MIAPDPVPAIQSVTATSVMGWGGFTFSLIACGVLIWKEVTGKGRSLAVVDGKLDKLRDQINDLEGRLDVVDGLSESVRELTQEWRGVAGDNGYRSIIRENSRTIAEIKTGFDRLNWLREEDERRSGGQHRRLADRELDNLRRDERG